LDWLIPAHPVQLSSPPTRNSKNRTRIAIPDAVPEGDVFRGSRPRRSTDIKNPQQENWGLLVGSLETQVKEQEVAGIDYDWP